jgi:hypothetical protein
MINPIDWYRPLEAHASSKEPGHNRHRFPIPRRWRLGHFAFEGQVVEFNVQKFEWFLDIPALRVLWYHGGMTNQGAEFLPAFDLRSENAEFRAKSHVRNGHDARGFFNENAWGAYTERAGRQ